MGGILCCERLVLCLELLSMSRLEFNTFLFHLSLKLSHFSFTVLDLRRPLLDELTVDGAHYYLCGPEPMLRHVHALLGRRGVPLARSELLHSPRTGRRGSDAHISSSTRQSRADLVFGYCECVWLQLPAVLLRWRIFIHRGLRTGFHHGHSRLGSAGRRVVESACF